MFWKFNMRFGRVLRLGVLPLLFLLSSCNNDDDGQGVIDCVREAALVQIADDNDQGGMTVEFQVQYSGDLSVTAVNWDFGDGTKGSGSTVSHLYINSGTYSVQALVDLSSGPTLCTAEPSTTITIQ